MKIEKNSIFVIFSLICLMGHRCPIGFYGYQKFNWMTTLDLVSLYLMLPYVGNTGITLKLNSDISNLHKFSYFFLVKKPQHY